MAMSMQRAVEVLGINRTRAGDLREMVKALSLHPWLNSAEENERREAAQFVLRRWGAYQAAGDQVRNRRGRG
jgi:hypothetical protein